MSRKILLFLSLLLISISGFYLGKEAFAAPDISVYHDLSDTSNTPPNSLLEKFIDSNSARDIFFVPGGDGGVEGGVAIFITIAFQLKNFFIILAVIFLIVGVIQLLLASKSDEGLTKWKNNVIWVTVGILVMQIAFSLWRNFLFSDETASFNALFSWDVWNNILGPIVSLLQFLAGFIFLAMMIYAFYLMVVNSGDEQKVKESYRVVGYAVVGFLLVRLPQVFVSLIYGGVPDCGSEKVRTGLWGYTACSGGATADLKGVVGVIGQIFTWINTFLTILCVILVLYAGWLVLISGGDKEKLKKAKNIVIYIIIGLILLIASHAIVRFLIMESPK